MRPVHDEDCHEAGAKGKLMDKIKNDPARYRKRAISAPKAQLAVVAINKASPFFTAPITRGHYLEFRAAVAPKPKRARGNTGN